MRTCTGPTVALAYLFVLALFPVLALAQRAPVEAKRGMVASASALASQVGVEILKEGGNAADAAVATALALAVTYPRAGNLGGGGFAVLWLADGRTTRHFGSGSRHAKERRCAGRFPESRRVFLRDGRLYEAGELFRQPDLAATLGRLARDGHREFYSGKTARPIAEEMSTHGGLITAADLAGYRAVERTPLHGSYRGHEIVTMPPPSSGGVALLQMLGMLEARDVSTLGLNSAARIHLFAEVMRRAFRDRAQFLGDPDFVRVPATDLRLGAMIRAARTPPRQRGERGRS